MKKKSLAFLSTILLFAITACTDNGSQLDPSGPTPPTPGGDTTFTVSFKSLGQDSGTQLTTLDSALESGSQYIGGSQSLSNVYNGTYGLKIGSSRSGSGTVSVSLSSKYKIKKIVASACKYSETAASDPVVTINDVSNTVSSAKGTLENYVFEYSSEETDTFNLTCNRRFYLKSLTFTIGEIEPIVPTGISMKSNLELYPGKGAQLEVTYTPSNANASLDLSWSSDDPGIVSVNNEGYITANSNAKEGDFADITATLVANPKITATCRVDIKEKTISDGSWSIFIYMCGADLESQNSFATSDLNEILSVAGQPDDVNIIIETGGAKSWHTSGIDANKLCRFEVRNKKLVIAEGGHVASADMGKASTLQSFLTWGFENYPADKSALILWNHGGAMEGVCFDEKFETSRATTQLMNDEDKSACTAAINASSNIDKLEWIGYDACLMAVQDIAEFNSSFANYMVAAEETELGEGWDYDNWIDDLYAKEDTETILTAICDSFIASVDYLIAHDSDYSGEKNDQTLAWFDLSKMATYKTAWENLAAEMNKKSYNKSNFQSFMKTVKYYAGSYYVYYGIFDAKDFLNKLRKNSTFGDGLSSYIDSVLAAHSNLVGYNAKGSAAGESYGICLFFSINSNCNKATNYSSTQTNFTNWRTFVNTYGN